MQVRREAPAATDARLRRVLASAELVVRPQPYAFVEAPAAALPVGFAGEALGFVRDEQVWSTLVPADVAQPDRLLVFTFHFAPDLDNSGFVGWLASRLMGAVGTGVVVLCGHNSARGGIFDHWAVPESVGGEVLDELQRLRRG